MCVCVCCFAVRPGVVLIPIILPLRFCLKVSLLNDLNGIGSQSWLCSLGNERQQQEACPLSLPNLFQIMRANVPKQEVVQMPSTNFLRA